MISAEDVKFVQKRFSSAAERYERLAFIQNDIRRELLDRLGDVKGKRILDIGCGTGALLSDLAERDPSGYRVGVDFALGMAESALSVDGVAQILLADAGMLPFREETFDVVVSSSSYQWVRDLTGAFCDVKRVLKNDGRFQAAFFVKGTLQEFWESLEGSGCKKGRFLELPSEDDVRSALEKAGFQTAAVSFEKRETVFRDVWTLLVWLKTIGANNLGRGVCLGRETIARVQEYYERSYSKDSGIRVSFEVAWIEAGK